MKRLFSHPANFTDPTMGAEAMPRIAKERLREIGSV